MKQDLTDTDKTHIQRLQALRESGLVNMFTEVRRGLIEMYGDEDGKATYEWVTDNFDYYMSGEWVEVEP